MVNLSFLLSVDTSPLSPTFTPLWEGCTALELLSALLNLFTGIAEALKDISQGFESLI